MFLSKVDKEKYPEVMQEYRFERVIDKDILDNYLPEKSNFTQGDVICKVNYIGKSVAYLVLDTLYSDNRCLHTLSSNGFYTQIHRDDESSYIVIGHIDVKDVLNKMKEANVDLKELQMNHILDKISKNLILNRGNEMYHLEFNFQDLMRIYEEMSNIKGKETE